MGSDNVAARYLPPESKAGSVCSRKIINGVVSWLTYTITTLNSLVLQGIVIFLFACETASTVMACISVHEQLLILKPGSFEALFQLRELHLCATFC